MAANKPIVRFLVVLISVLLALLLTSCSVLPDYRMQALMLVKPPDKLIYVIRQDQKLNASGGRIIEYADFNGGRHVKISLESYDYDAYDGKYFHTNANLIREGTYIVSIAKRHLFFFWKRYFQFTIQVVSPGKYNVDSCVPEDDFTYEELEPTYCENATAYMLTPPSNIIYPVGHEGAIDLSGLVVKPVEGMFVEPYNITDLDYTLEGDVDFNTPGNYIVKVFFTDDRGRDLWFCFTVAVAEPVEE